MNIFLALSLTITIASAMPQFGGGNVNAESSAVSNSEGGSFRGRPGFSGPGFYRLYGLGFGDGSDIAGGPGFGGSKAEGEASAVANVGGTGLVGRPGGFGTFEGPNSFRGPSFGFPEGPGGLGYGGSNFGRPGFSITEADGFGGRSAGVGGPGFINPGGFGSPPVFGAPGFGEFGGFGRPPKLSGESSSAVSNANANFSGGGFGRESASTNAESSAVNNGFGSSSANAEAFAISNTF